VRQIHHLTRGVPRRINLLCGRALLGAWAHGATRVNRAIVNKAAQEVFGAEPQVATQRRAMTMGFVLAGIALVVALGGLGTWWFAAPAESAAALKPATAALLASPASAPGSVPVKAMPSVGPLEPFEDLLPMLPREPQAAWNALATYWKLPDTTATPCAAAAIGPWECYQTKLLTVPQLRQLARPGVLRLRLDDGATAYVVVIALNNEMATLRVNGASRTVRLAALLRMWDGNYATYWRAPAGYKPPEQGGGASPFFESLTRQLAQIDGTPPPQPLPQSLDAALRSQVLDFQRSYGLTPDGLPGPLTLMQIESVLAAAAPRPQ
jgi:general secretion pathway protein A